jgi:SRSO17 transposase
MTLKQIASLGRKLTAFLFLFADCFKRKEGHILLLIFVRGLLSDVHRKNCEAIALRFGCPPRTLQRFLESVKWHEERLRDKCQIIIATEHLHPDAVGLIDESGNTKSGPETAGVDRQYNGNRGKIENCVVGVHLGYAAPGFQTLIDSQMYLTKECVDDPLRRKKTTSQRMLYFRPNSRLRFLWFVEHSTMAYALRLGLSTRRMVVITSS